MYVEEVQYLMEISPNNDFYMSNKHLYIFLSNDIVDRVITFNI